MNNSIREILIEIDVIFENLEDMMSEEGAKDYQLKYNQLKLYILDQQKEIEELIRVIELRNKAIENMAEHIVELQDKLFDLDLLKDSRFATTKEEIIKFYKGVKDE